VILAPWPNGGMPGDHHRLTTMLHVASTRATKPCSARPLNLAVASVNSEINSLYALAESTASWVGSEPLDPAADWRPVPEHSLVTLRPGTIEVRPIEHDGITP